jgi:hypothetical protein
MKARRGFREHDARRAAGAVVAVAEVWLDDAYKNIVLA